jgi:hypothetical protein
LPNYFVGTTALAKRYHQENGSEYMDRIEAGISTTEGAGA